MAASATKRFRLEGDSGSAVSAFKNLELKLKDTDQAFGKVQRSAAGTGMSVKDVTGSVTRFATAVTAVGAVALREMSIGFQRFDQDAKTASASVIALEASLKSLVQISKTVGDNKGLGELADKLSKASGMTRAESLQIAFSGTSAGLSPAQLGIAAEIKRIEANPMQVVERLADLKAAFPDFAGGDPRGITNALLLASEKSKVPLASLAGISLNPAKVGQLLGAPPSESLAALSLSTIGAKSPEQAETQLASLMDQLNKTGQFKGMGVVGSLEKLSSMTEAHRGGVLTSKEALLGYESLKGRIGEIKTLRADIDSAVAGTGTGKDMLASRIRIAEQNPELQALHLQGVATQKLEQTMRTQGLRETLEQGIIAETKAELQRRYEAGDISRGTLNARTREVGFYDNLNMPLDKLAVQAADVGSRYAFQMQGRDTDVRDRLEDTFMRSVQVFMEASAEFKKSVEKSADNNREGLKKQRKFYMDQYSRPYSFPGVPQTASWVE